MLWMDVDRNPPLGGAEPPMVLVFEFYLRYVYDDDGLASRTIRQV